MSIAKEKENKAWINGVAGGLGSATSKTIMNPMQRVVVKYQLGATGSISSIVHSIIDEVRVPKGHPKDAPKPPFQAKHLGVFWKGNLISITQRIPYSGIQLMTYDRMKFAIANWLGAKEGDATDPRALQAKIYASGLAGCISGTATYPLEVIRTRQMSGSADCRTIRGAIQTTYAESGLIGFYSGLAPALVQRVPDIIINLTVYESVKFYLGAQGYSDRMCVCGGGATAALTAIAFTYPIDVVKRRMAAGKSAGHDYKSPIDCARRLMVEEGFSACYRGATIEAARCVPQVIMMWSLIEFFRHELALLA